MTAVLDALTQWVRQGGHLVVCQPSEPMKIKPFFPMLPVVTDESGIKMVDSRDISPLRRMAGVEQKEPIKNGMALIGPSRWAVA